MIALCCALLVQAGAWTVTPARPTVGDTIHLERVIAAPAGWRVRPGRLETRPGAGAVTEPLGDPAVAAAPGGWMVRYVLVAWMPGSVTVALPPIWRLGPDGSADSIPGGSAVVTLASVIPDTLADPAPQPALAPYRPDRRRWWPPATALVLAVGALLGVVAWRRRPPRPLADVPAPRGGAGGDRDRSGVPDARWLAAAEPKAVAARATHALREAIARALPAAHEGLSTAECLAAIERERPDWPLRELTDALTSLDHVAFASAFGTDVGSLAARARALALELER